MKNFTSNDITPGVDTSAKIVRQTYSPKGSVIPRATEVPQNFRDENEIAAATYMGKKPHEVHSLYKDVYEFYQNNEY